MFETEDGTHVPAVTAAQMREVDRVTAEDFGLGILQMMENAGRNLAISAIDLAGPETTAYTVLAGGGGNGGGGLCCARHLLNRGLSVAVVLDRRSDALVGAAQVQYRVLRASGLEEASRDQIPELLGGSRIVIDALIGYSLRGAPRGRAAELITMCNEAARSVLSLDVPSGMDATSGEAPGVVVRADRTVTLALPKTGLRGLASELFLADIGIPPQVFECIGLPYVPLFGTGYYVRLLPAPAARTLPQ